MFFKHRSHDNDNKKPIKNEIIDTISAKSYSDLDEEERKEWSPIKPGHEKIPLFCKISLCIAALSLIIYAATCLSEKFADFFNRHVSSFFRLIFAKITNVLPFSLAELLIILLPVIGFMLIWYLLKFRCETVKTARITTVCILAISSLLFSSFVMCFSAGYRGASLDVKLGLDSQPVSPQELYDASDYLTERINELAPEIKYDESGFSIMPYSFSEMNDKLIEAYSRFCEKHNFINNFKSKLKPIFLSEPLSYTHITGIYTYFTGEANINVNFPDYSIPFTAAHELAHQRGIAREDEANMMAFLVCMESDDPYIRYSAYTNVYEYVVSALYKADKDMYRNVRAKLSRSFYNEQVAFSKFFDKYEKSVASQVSGVVNDAYLQSQGTVGKRSYGMVVDLTVSYFKSKSIID